MAVEKWKMPNVLTYISLFSGAGVGCYGFKQEGFECVATNEIVSRRLTVQKSNDKCKYQSGYILGDISSPAIKELLFSEILLWQQKEYTFDIDVVIATPPCQGMSVANHKKATNEIVRNSLIIESIKLIAKIQPKVFIFENVPLFMKTLCTDTDGTERPIGEAIERNLNNHYSIFSQVLNFKDYGVCSSRTRTLVIAVRKDLADFISPLELFPLCKPERTLRQTIGDMKPLTVFGEIDPTDIYHTFRVYPKHMQSWLSELSEGQSAFDNKDESHIPHQIINGKVVYNQRKNGDKYRRQIWDKIGPCVHTRNDQLASQNTIHPSDDRVFSIRELMAMMTVPLEFKWTDMPFDKLNVLNDDEKRKFLKNEEIKIRQSLGEAVPTTIFRDIAVNIKAVLGKRYLKDTDIKHEIYEQGLIDVATLISYIKKNPLNLGFASLCRIVELANSKRTEQDAYFTNKSLVTEIMKTLPDIDGDSISILEPSVGGGSFLPLIIRLYERKTKVTITAIDIDNNTLTVLKELVKQHINLPANVQIEYICDNFLSRFFFNRYNIVVGNPPFSKSACGKQLKFYRAASVNKRAINISAFFLEKAIKLGDYTALIMPKFLLNTPEFELTREFVSKYKIDTILDFGECGFNGVLIETVALCLNTMAKPTNTLVISVTDNQKFVKQQSYICDSRFPYWLIYRNMAFDEVCDKLQFGVFDVFRDRQITNTILNNEGIRVIRSRNIAEDGSAILDIDGYDAYIASQDAEKLAVYKYLLDDSVYLAPNMTYKPRVVRKPKGVLTNGSTAILSLKDGEPPLCQEELNYFVTDEYREFYRTARNRQTRSLNIDANSVFFFGRLKTEKDMNV
jgi:DNA (cytosine-5)-methyltransferase 1